LQHGLIRGAVPGFRPPRGHFRARPTLRGRGRWIGPPPHFAGPKVIPPEFPFPMAVPGLPGVAPHFNPAFFKESMGEIYSSANPAAKRRFLLSDSIEQDSDEERRTEREGSYSPLSPEGGMYTGREEGRSGSPSVRQRTVNYRDRSRSRDRFSRDRKRRREDFEDKYLDRHSRKHKRDRYSSRRDRSRSRRSRD